MVDKGIPGIEALQRLTDELLGYNEEGTDIWEAIMADYETVNTALRGLT